MPGKYDKRTAQGKATAGAKKNAEEKLIEKLRHYIRTEGPRFLEDPNITSVGIAYKIKHGKRTKDLCLQFTVGSKPDEAGALPEGVATERIPEELKVAGQMIPTDVLQRTYELSYQVIELEEAVEISDRKLRRDPLVPGISVSHPSGSAGTLGMVVFDRFTGNPCMLSNWHVLHRSTGNIGDSVVQPGPFDDNRVNQNHAGTLLRSHLGAAGDCAIAQIDDRDFETDILDLGVTPARIARVDLDDRVIKSGRTTGVTRGMVRRIDVMASISYEGVGERSIGAFEIEPLEGAPADFEVSLGGDSGSVWMIANPDGTSTDILAGLHFAGEGRNNPDEHALACYAHSVFRKLDIRLAQPADPEEVSQLGYNSQFLSERVLTPRLTKALKEDAFELDGSHLIPYVHFSVCQSKGRTLPRFVASNVDGMRIKTVSRVSFRRDDRVPDQFQAGNELYQDNPLDRGHIARRAILAWGSLDEAKKSNRDSFFYTNIAPQHARFNQSRMGGLWGELENAIFEDVQVENLRISVMAGPVFKDDDPIHRGVQIPRDFWKLIAYKDTVDDQFKVRAYILTQTNLLSDLEALELDPFRLFQVSLDQLRNETKLNFSTLSDFDTFSSDSAAEELVMEAREVHGRGDLLR